MAPGGCILWASMLPTWKSLFLLHLKWLFSQGIMCALLLSLPSSWSSCYQSTLGTCEKHRIRNWRHFIFMMSMLCFYSIKRECGFTVVIVSSSIVYALPSALLLASSSALIAVVSAHTPQHFPGSCPLLKLGSSCIHERIFDIPPGFNLYLDYANEG